MTVKRLCGFCDVKTKHERDFSNGKAIWRCQCCGTETPRRNRRRKPTETDRRLDQLFNELIKEAK